MLLLSVNFVAKPALAIGTATDKQVAHVKIAQADAEVPDEIGALAQQICLTYDNGHKTVTNIDSMIQNHLAFYHKLPDPTPEQITLFLNKHKDNMTCTINGEQVHYMHYSFYDSGFAFFSLFKKYLSDKVWMNIEDESINIDVNAVSYFQDSKQPETVLDYMLRESARLPKGDERKARIEQVIFIFKNDFNAKTYGQLVEEN